MKKKRVVLAFGTRPEATKMAPVHRALAAHEGIEAKILSTGQQREMLDAAMLVFGLKADEDLQVMTERQSLAELTGRIVPRAGSVLRKMEADMVLVHGDTSTSFCVALSAFYEGIAIGHVEAGLRSFDLASPFPEEANRRLTGVLSGLDFAPTAAAKENLLREGKNPDDIFITGQTAVDAVRGVAGEHEIRREWAEILQSGQKIVTVTMHRRENLPVLGELAAALRRVSEALPELHFIYPVHLNPAVGEKVRPVLQDLPNWTLCEPLDYAEMAPLMAASTALLTDSGGLQEEGAALGVPVGVLRDVTERPEGLAAGVLRLLGSEAAGVERGALEMLQNETLLQQMRTSPNPYGDGRAAERIAAAVAWRLRLGTRPADWNGV